MGDPVRCGLDSVVGLAERGQVTVVVDEDVAASHEVRVALDGRKLVEVGKQLLQERLLLLRRARRAELSKSDDDRINIT